MEPGMGCVTTLAVLWAPVHLYLTQTDWRALRNWLGRIGVAADRNVLKEKRVEEEMLSLRQRNYKLFSSFISHLNFFSMYGFSYDALAAPELDNIFVAACCILSYVQHLMVAQEWLSMSPQRLKLVAVLHHSAGLLLRIMTGISASPMKFAVMHGFNIAVRFMLVFTFLDPWVSIPFQVLYTLADVFEYVLLFEGTSEQAGSLWYSQFFICLLSIAASILIDSVLRARIYALLDTADAESLVSSFRRVLRGVCDGEVLLDSHMNVAKESECLKHLILTNVSLTGSSFLDLLDGEQHRFKAFIDSSMASPEPKDSLKRTDTPPANGLRVSLRGSEGVRVAADLYHVPVPGLFGAKEPFHLIAFKEDLDSRTHPEAAEGAVPDALQLSGGGCAANASRDPIGQQTDTASIRSASTSRSSSAPAAFLDLQDDSIRPSQRAHNPSGRRPGRALGRPLRPAFGHAQPEKAGEAHGLGEGPFQSVQVRGEVHARGCGGARQEHEPHDGAVAWSQWMACGRGSQSSSKPGCQGLATFARIPPRESSTFTILRRHPGKQQRSMSLGYRFGSIQSTAEQTAKDFPYTSVTTLYLDLLHHARLDDLKCFS
ncbi:unnamed protein product [Durusdinium trenchii]|uniref:TLC domain-containing protein n=1 Tax=Durusdinium trenchii TaxID=1381693 RepID=A0ABP0MXP5_9DINO